MNRPLMIVCATALLIARCHAQAQSEPTQLDMTPSEFRQVLVDMGSYLDAHKGTDLARQFAAIPDNALSNMYPAVVNPRQLQRAVAALKADDAAKAARPKGLDTQTLVPQAVVGSCLPGAIIDDSAGSACTPAFADPNNSAWQNMVNPLITFGAFSPTDYPHVATQQCSLTVESNLVQVVAALNGTVTAAAIGCSALQAVPVGGTVASGVCDVAVAVVAVAGAVSQGLLADCFEEDADVNSAKIDAGFHNTVTIFNALGTDFTALGTHLTSVNNQITGEFTALDTHLTNVDNHVTTEFGALDAHLVTLVNQLSTQISQSTSLLGADLKQVMKLELTPDGLKVINPLILTCTGTNCPNVLAACPAAGCSWNNVGPLP
jgi:hypothetical protein